MEPGPLARVPFPIMIGVVAGLALLVEYLGVDLKFGLWSLALLVIPAALALAYLIEFRRLPYEPPAARPASGSAPQLRSVLDDEPFVDPVEEADRWETEHHNGPEQGGSAPPPPAESPPSPPSEPGSGTAR